MTPSRVHHRLPARSFNWALPIRNTCTAATAARLALAASTTGGAAGGVLVAVWAAARDAVTPGQPVPHFGLDLGLTVIRALTQATLEPIIGGTGSRPIFWAALTVFLTLFALIAALATPLLPRRLRTSETPAPPPGVRDPVIVPVAWHRPTRATADPLLPPSPPLSTHLPGDQHPRIAADEVSTRQAAPTTPRPTNTPADGGLDTLAAGLWVTIGVADQQPVALNLCAQRGLGLTGPGADGCARHLLATLLTRAAPANGAPHRDTEPALVVIPVTHAHHLLSGSPTHGASDPTTDPGTELDADGRFPNPLGTKPPAGRAQWADWADQAGEGRRLYQAPTLGVALTYLEQQLLARARTDQPHPDTHLEAGTQLGRHVPVVLFAEPEPANLARIEAIVAHGARYRIAAVFTGPWPTGATLCLGIDGSVAPGPPQRANLAALTKACTISSHQLHALLHRPSTPTPRARRDNMLNTATKPTSQTTSKAVANPTGDPTPDTEPTTATTVARPAAGPSARLSTGRPHTPTPPPTPSGIDAGTKPALPPQPVDDGADAAGDHAHPTPGWQARTRHRVTEPTPTTAAGITSDITSVTTSVTADAHTVDPGASSLGSSDAVLLVGCFAGLRVRTGAAVAAANGPADEQVGRDITARLSPQDRRVLACLALHPDGVAADNLQEILWPGTAYRAAGKRLRTALGHLRAVLREATGLPDATFAAHREGRYHLGAHPDDARIWVDYTAFGAALRAARVQTGPARLEALHQIAALYTGLLGKGIDLDWPELSTLQHAARRSATTALATLAGHYEHHQPDKAIALLTTLLTHDPTAEKPAELLTTLYLRSGNPRAAQHTYARLATQLATLGRHPSNTITDALQNQNPQSLSEF